MRILVITGSAHKKGTSSCLADAFIKGAEESGHTVCRFDAAFKNVHPCIGCGFCQKNECVCVFKDDMQELNPELLKAEAVVFVSPIYYYDINAQIKAVIDRFYANNSVLKGADKKAILMLTYGDETEESAEGAIASFKGMIKYLEWENAGIISAKGCYVLDDVINSEYPKQAYELGKSL